MKDGKLEKGDKVYFANRYRLSEDIKYIFEEVERLTPTQAILTNGARLKNKITKDWNGNLCFIEHGDREKWYIVTDKVLEDAKKEAQRQKTNSWFSKQQFTDEQKQQIYNLFNT